MYSKSWVFIFRNHNTPLWMAWKTVRVAERGARYIGGFAFYQFVPLWDCQDVDNFVIKDDNNRLTKHANNARLHFSIQLTRLPSPLQAINTYSCNKITKVSFFHQCSKMQIIPIQNLTFKLVFSIFFGFSDWNVDLMVR